VLWPERNQSASFIDGNGTQACVSPAGLSIARRVTIWNVRHALGVGANRPCANAATEKAGVTDTAATPFKNSRLQAIIVFLLAIAWMHSTS